MSLHKVTTTHQTTKRYIVNRRHGYLATQSLNKSAADITSTHNTHV